jgi:hypothetical protein
MADHSLNGHDTLENAHGLTLAGDDVVASKTN